jgi:predicted nucleic acid-binding protein
MLTCIDTNILIYAFDKNSIYYEKCISILKTLSNNKELCICDISLIEFFQVITNSKKFAKPISPEDTQKIILGILADDNIKILYSEPKILKLAFENINNYKIIKYEIYDLLIAMNLKLNNLTTFLTLNIEDFKKYEFLEVINPCK